ncbi:FtsX-like permease family protein [Amycolatopsis magusensis]|uniref:ABC transport system permease protein n=2 Tax=Amycolatopsis magusensis TaxID=882444 RepID=A0ABS4Q5U1_9PSEU|nr:FtsX-like permease family protein [Amycolatopsis magusensis]MBP2187053.1 putative ABC transport system permease protein [Amycolatopsis magusensis]
MFRIATRMLRFRKGGFTASFIALFFGAAIVLACGGLMETGIRSAVPPERFAAAPLVISGNQQIDLPEEPVAPDEEDYGKDRDSGVLSERVRLDAGLITRIEKLQGVERALPDVTFDVHENGRRLPGHGWSSAELAGDSLVAGVAPTRAGQVALPGHQPGETVELAVRGKVERFTVTGTIAGPSAFFTDGEASRLLGKAGVVDAIAVFTTPGTDVEALREQVDKAISGTPAISLTGDERGLAEFFGAAEGGTGLIALAGVFGGMATTVAIFVVASTLGLSVQQRGRELALLRAIGTTPGQLRRMVLGETMVVGVLATLLAYFPGQWLGEFLFDQLAGRGVVAEQMIYHQGWIPMVSATGAALLTAFGAAFVAGGRAARARPAEALAEAAVQRRWLSAPRLIIALLCLGGGIALVIITFTVMTGPVAASTAGPTVMLWAIALALLGPGIARIAIATLRWPLRAITGLSGRLALLNARNRRVRMAAAITPIMLASGMALSMIYLQTTQGAAGERAFSENLRADTVLASTTGGFDPSLVGTVAELPGVAGASALVTSSGFITDYDDGWQDDQGLPLQGITAEGAGRTTATPFTAGSVEELRGETAALPASLAESLGKGIGDTVTLRFGDGAQTDVRIAGLLGGRPGYEIALVPASLLVPHTDAGTVPQILVKAEPGADLAPALAGLAERVPGLVVADRATVTAANAEQQDIGAWVNYLLVAMIVGYTVISLVNTLVLATAERRREFALQRLVGSTRGQVLRMTAVEAVLVAVAGLVLGGFVSLTTLVPFSLVISDTPMPAGPIGVLLAVVGGSAGLVLLATLVPAWFALRARPVEAAVAP